MEQIDKLSEDLKRQYSCTLHEAIEKINVATAFDPKHILDIIKKCLK